MKIKSIKIIFFAKLVYLRKIITIFSRSKIVMKIYYLFIFENQVLFFEFKEISHLIIYIHFIDAFIKTIFFRNNFEKSI